MAVSVSGVTISEPVFWPHPLLAIETSCDETAAALVCGRKVLSNVVASQLDLHAQWGGVVPEAASRAHVEAILPVIQEALLPLAGEKPSGIVVTTNPGLVGALSVGLTAAKGLASAWKLPLLGVNHLEGHVMALCAEELGEIPPLPMLVLVVSGGHTELVLVREWGKFELIGQTLDDAAGEAFDKAARLMGLGTPGGKVVQEAAKSGNPKRYQLPRGLKKDPFNFSFSGLKTAVLRLVEAEDNNLNIPDACASLQAVIVRTLTEKATAALEEIDCQSFGLAGGVSANVALRESFASVASKRGIPFYCPPFDLCTDNAGMIGLAGSFRFARGERSDWSLDVSASGALSGL